MTDFEKLDLILALLRQIDGELGCIPEVQAIRKCAADFALYQEQIRSNEKSELKE